MCVCMYVCIYACMYVCMQHVSHTYSCGCVCVYVCIHLHEIKRKWLSITPIYAYVGVSVCMHMYICMYTHIHAYIHIPTIVENKAIGRMYVNMYV
jgi:hypothetical protein